MTTPRVSSAAQLVAWSGALVFAASLGWFLYCYAVRFDAAPAGASAARAVASNVALFSLFALHHSILARSGAKGWVRTRVPAALERSVYTWTASLLFILVCTAWQRVPGVLYTLDGLAALAGYAIQAAGIVLTLRGAAAVDPLDLAGLRPIVPKATTDAPALETTGLYGFVRHPVYFAWILLVLGTPDMTATRATFAVVSVLYLAVAIPFEERGLVERFGGEYERYRRKVRWRMMPGLY